MSGKMLSFMFISSMIFLTSNALAEDVPGPFQGTNAPKAESAPVPEEFSVLRTNCYTNVRDCAGLAYWRNNSASGWGCTIWWNNGANGRSNFSLWPDQSVSYHVRYNDTYSCVDIDEAPPSENVGRDYIWVN